MNNRQLHISASSIKCLESCPREWWYRYVEGRTPEHTPANLVIGSVIHESTAYFYQELKDFATEPNLEQLISLAHLKVDETAAGLIPILYDKNKNIKWLKEEIERLIKVFIEQCYRPYKIICVEEEFNIPPFNPESGEIYNCDELITGRFDLVCQDKESNLIIIDHKTAAKANRLRLEEPDVQMALYSIIAKQLYNENNVCLMYQEIYKTKTARIEINEVKKVKNHEIKCFESIVGAIELIHTVIQHPQGKTIMGRRRTWKCKQCCYRNYCKNDIIIGVNLI